MGKLRPAFDKKGTVTAGNASGINDGASAVVIASEDAVERLGLTPLCEIVSTAQTGLDPKVMGLGPVKAVQKALEKAELSVTDVDTFEFNEAFAAQALGVIRRLADECSVSSESIIEKSTQTVARLPLGIR